MSLLTDMAVILALTLFLSMLAVVADAVTNSPAIIFGVGA